MLPPAKKKSRKRIPSEVYEDFMMAIVTNDTEIIDEFLKIKPPLDKRVSFLDDSMTPLTLTCLLGKPEILRKLIKANADVDVKELNDTSPLYVAAQEGHDKIADLLIEAQAEIDFQSADGTSPLYLASQHGHHRVVRSLIEAQASVDLRRSNGASALCIAAQNGHRLVTDLLIRAQADVNIRADNSTTPLYIASHNGHHLIVELLLKARADPNLLHSDGTFPLYVAAYNGHYQVVSLIVDAGAEVNLRDSQGCSSLIIASQNGHRQVVDVLISANVDVNLPANNGATPIYMASQEGHKQVVDVLIKAQADINLLANGDASPIYTAAQEGHDQVVDSLIHANADVNFQRSNGQSLLFIAAQEGHEKVVELLLKSGADPDLPTGNGWLPLHAACKQGHHMVADLLIKAQSDINHLAQGSLSPLLLAIEQGHSRVVELLIKAQAEVDLTISTGVSLFEVAKMLGHDRVTALLQEATASSTASSETLQANELKNSKQALEDVQLSLELNSTLTKAGFVSSRAAMQSVLADVLQEILRKRWNGGQIFVVGSYSEGWGNSLKTLDGRPDVESDIDVMRLIDGRLYHLNYRCNCSEDEKLLVNYENGHIFCPGYASTPANPTTGSNLRPAVDEVSGVRLCCYPLIAPLLTQRLEDSQIPGSVLSALQQELTSSPCHVVHAAPPGHAGEQLRLSTTFLERRLLRSLSTLQGQLFVTIKYIVKKVICHKEGFNAAGLKAYHMKTITFRMLERTPREIWKPENLVFLIRESLLMLINDVRNGCTPQNTDGRIMDHFFLCDAALYLKGVDRSQSMLQTLEATIQVLEEVTANLPQFILKFIKSLKPVSDSGRFYFHPFLILPYLNQNPIPLSGRIEYHEIYDVVRKSLLCLTHDGSSYQSQLYLTEIIARLPDSARTTREVLRALACLKFGYKDSAKKIIKYTRSFKVSRGFDLQAEDLLAAEATPEKVWNHLRTQDSAWKFNFHFETRPEFQFLPELWAACFPTQTLNFDTCFYINFDAMLQSMRFQLLVDEEETTVQSWIRDVAGREDADEQEVTVALLCLRDEALFKPLLDRAQWFPAGIPKRILEELKARFREDNWNDSSQWGLQQLNQILERLLLR
ncbi:hypothetical protein BOX15_Mlig015480g1 [Macrostomum lignano]|uniref:Uncharacterized protein n=1 Tax=Macrostomum lignano TaxID=282301 RepID=A0A267FH91_9PLAT|nr:hypothetical protein BOX15_Mlig015480g1 [Macrostomum lignano]